jgi:hypothetical protein
MTLGPTLDVAEQNLSAAAWYVFVFVMQAAEATVLVVVAGDAQIAALVVTVAPKAA